MNKTVTNAKLSCAVAAVLGFAAMAQAGTLPYSTSFEFSPADAENQTYTLGGLVGQNGWAAEDGEATVNNASANVVGSPDYQGTHAVTLTTKGVGSTASPTYSDFYNSSVADHTGGAGGTPYTPTPYTNVNISFAMDTNIGTSGALTGMEIFDSNDDEVAALFAAKAPGGPVLYTDNGTTPPEQIDTANGFGSNSFAAPDGTYGVYSISLNPTAGTFTVSYDGQTFSETLPADFSGKFGGFAISTVDTGAVGSATFDSLNIVSAIPEPASFAMIGIGTLLALARRPKRAE